MATAGVAIGLGNIWRFPYMMGLFGGAAFLIVYLLVVLAFGVPALMCEWALGRHTRRGPMGAFERARLPAGRWWGYLLLLTIIMASSYYSVVLGWVLYYGFLFASSAAVDPAQQIFGHLTANLPLQFLFVWISLALGCLALVSGVKSGIERISRLITPLFFGLFVFLIVQVLSLEGAAGKVWEFLWRWEDFSSQTVLGALGQGMFSLSLGGTFMVIYGSYLRKEEDIPRNALCTASLDVSAALMASLIVIPPVLVFGIDLASGPSLLFVVMGEVFQKLAWGSLLGAVFFFSIFLVAMLSLIGAYEVIVGAFQDVWGWRRRKTLGFIVATQSVLIVPPILSPDKYIFYSDLVWGSTMQPFGAALAVVALVWSIGRTRALEEIKRQSRLPVPPFLFYWIKYAVPVGVTVGLIYGWLG